MMNGQHLSRLARSDLLGPASVPYPGESSAAASLILCDYYSWFLWDEGRRREPQRAEVVAALGPG